MVKTENNGETNLNGETQHNKWRITINGETNLKAFKFNASQVEMVATQWAFCGLIVTKWRELGVAESSLHLLPDFLHFWRTIGHLMGIEDRSDRGWQPLRFS